MKENITAFSLEYKGKKIEIQRTNDWYINATQLSKAFGKNFKDWKRHNRQRIEIFQILEGTKKVIYDDSSRYPQTFVDLKLAIQVLSSYDHTFAYQLSSIYQKAIREDSTRLENELSGLKEKLKLFEKGKQKTLARRPTKGKDLPSGNCLYLITSDTFKDKEGHVLHRYKLSEKDYKFGRTSNINEVVKAYRRLKPRIIVCKLFYGQKSDVDLLEKVLKKRWQDLLTQISHEEVWHAKLDNLVKDVESGVTFLKINGFFIEDQVLENYNEWSLLADQFL